MKHSNGFAALEALKNEMDNQRRIEQENYSNEMRERRNRLMKKIGFKTPEEMIEYLMRGKKIVDREGQSFQLVDGAVEMVYEIYDECAGPQGYGKKYKTIADFKKFVYGVLDKNRTDEWIPVWVKEEYINFI